MVAAVTTTGAVVRSTRKRVVVVGAGFGGLAAAKALGSPDDGSPVEVTVVDRLNYHLFQPLLYQVALAGLAATDIAYPIRAALHGGATSRAAGRGDRHRCRRARRRASTTGRRSPYDYLVVAAGARTSYFGHDDWARFAPGLKDLDDALEIRRRVLIALEAAERAADPAERQRLLTFVVVGGGPTGVELAGAIADLSRDILANDFRRVDRKAVRVVLVEMADRILTPFDPSLSARARTQLEELGVEVRTGVRVESIDARGVTVGGETVAGRDGAVGRGRAAEPARRGAGRAARRRRPRHRRPRLRGARASRAVRHRRHGVVHARRRVGAAARHQPGRDPAGARGRGSNILRELAGEPRMPFRYFDKGFMATIGRARAVAAAAGACACRGCSPGWRGCSCTSGTWSASATDSRCSRTGSGRTSSRATARASSPGGARRRRDAGG